jgi:quinol-cytochrome oxidoreductase complex cytochrome b subunit
MSSQSNSGKPRKLMPFFPDYILDEAIAWYAALGLLIVLASLFPAGLEEEANPLSTPAHIKPEWYFLFLYQSLKLVPRIVGVLAPAIVVLILLALPFVDRSPSRRFRDRAVLNGIGIITLVIIVALTAWGWLS